MASLCHNLVLSGIVLAITPHSDGGQELSNAWLETGEREIFRDLRMTQDSILVNSCIFVLLNMFFIFMSVFNDFIHVLCGVKGRLLCPLAFL